MAPVINGIGMADRAVYKVEIVSSTGTRKLKHEGKPNITGQQLLKALNLLLDNHIIVIGRTPVPIDRKLDHKKPITIFQTVSGG